MIAHSHNLHVHLREHLQVDDAYDFASRLLLQNFEEVLSLSFSLSFSLSLSLSLSLSHATPTAQYTRIPAAPQTRARWRPKTSLAGTYTLTQMHTQ
jgi:hypothetical protein